MTISLTPDQQRWLESKVATGAFATVDEAAQAILNEYMARDLGDLSWAKPHIDEARAQITRGEVVSHGDFKRALAERIKALG